MFFFFFFKHKTAYEMRISAWRSDVCSSDLQHYQPELGAETAEVEQNLDAWVAKVHTLKSHYFKRYMRHGRVPLRPGIARIMREARGSGVRLRSEERRVGIEGVGTCRSRRTQTQ